ncbi:hypothetical protein ACQPUL_00980 [Clostridium butyricum]|jgi:hypothetical protein|uniref:hypothetical protein n=1 Tax=Clostridium butyricum TaxID=1492 RepID=UPI000B0F729F|nr:hypothetical protein [Clostridium butyricum]
MDKFIKSILKSESNVGAIDYGIGWFGQEAKNKEENYTSSDILKLLKFLSDRLNKDN